MERGGERVCEFVLHTQLYIWDCGSCLTGFIYVVDFYSNRNHSFCFLIRLSHAALWLWEFQFGTCFSFISVYYRRARPTCPYTC